MRSFWLVFIFVFTGHFLTLGQEKDSLMNALKITKNSIERIDLLHELVVKIWLNYPHEAMQYAEEASRLSSEINDSAKIAKSLRLIGGIYYYQGNYDSVLVYCNQSLKIATNIGDTVLINNALNNLGLAYYNMGSYQNALENLLRSLNMKVALGEIYGRALTLNNLGLVYSKLKDYEKAREYFMNGLDFSKQTNDSNLVLYSQNNIGITYLRQENLETAEKYFEKSLLIDIDNKNWKSVAFAGLGQIHQKRGNYAYSRELFEKALKLREEIGDQNGISEIYYYYSKEAQRKGDYDKAFDLLGESQQIAKAIGAKERLYENISLYIELYEQRGIIEKAFQYQKRLLELRDTLFNENLARNLSSIELKIQDEQSQKVIQQKEIQLIKNQQLNFFLIIIFVLAIALALITMFAYNNNRKITKLLAERNAEIVSQKEEIETQKESLVSKNYELEKAHILITDQNEELSKYNIHLEHKVNERSRELETRNNELKLANLELDNFLYKSSHDIKGPLATLMGICNVALLDIKDPRALQYFQMLTETAHGLNDILARLKTISDINSLELQLDIIDFNALIDKCVRQIRNIEGIDNIKINYNVDPELKFSSDIILNDLVFFNMIQNAVKFRTPNTAGFLKIDVLKEGETVVIHFLDNGIGIKEEDAHDVFEMFSKTALEHQTLGLGLYIVKQCIQKMGGEIMLLNNDEGFTHFRIVIPL